MKLRRKAKETTAADQREPEPEVISIDVGFNRFHAQLLADACRNEGCVVELLTMDDSGTAPGLSAGVPHQLLVRRSELERVQAVLARSR